MQDSNPWLPNYHSKIIPLRHRSYYASKWMLPLRIKEYEMIFHLGIQGFKYAECCETFEKRKNRRVIFSFSKVDLNPKGLDNNILKEKPFVICFTK